MISRLMFMVPEVLVLLVFSRVAFGVVNHGSIFAVAVLIFLGAVMFAGIGLLVASRAKTIEAVSGLMNLVMLPMWIVSGIFFSSERFPDAVQPLIRALPLTPLIDSLRSVMLEGRARRSVAANRHHAGLGHRELCAGLALVPLAIRNCHGNSDRSRFRASSIFRIRKSLGPRQQCNRLSRAVLFHRPKIV